MKTFKRLALILALVLALVFPAACGSKKETPAAQTTQAAVQTTAAETKAPETKAPETKAPESKETEAPETEAPETEETETEAPETEAPETEETETEAPETKEELYIDPDGTYDSKDEVALYIHLYGELPSNYISKKEAQKLGWNGGGLDKYAPGKAIGGSFFGNYEGILPEEDSYTECDIDTVGKSKRGAKRIVFSDDGDIYYTEDHYETFTLLYTADGPVTEEIVFGN